MTYILIQSQAANTAKGILLIRPSVRAVKDVNGRRVDLLRLHHLHAHRPSRIIAPVDGIEEVLDVVIGLFAGETDGRLGVHGFDSVVGLEVPLDVDIASILQRCQASVLPVRIS